jgi:hypothetical protein
VDEQSHSHIQLLKLSGFWQADEFNRLVFLVKKDALPGEPLTFNGIWQINQNQQIIYTYEKRDLKTKSKISHTLGFIGFWQITSADRLTYVLSRTLNSGFDFRAHLESPNLYPQQGVIKYRLGIGLRKNKLYKDKIICLYGAWKFSRKFSLIFEMDYSRGKVQQIEFGTDISLSQKDKVLLELKNKAGEPLGMHITFTRRFLNKLDAEVFLRLKAKQKERGIETGINIPF